jgi:hypothetical protein
MVWVLVWALLVLVGCVISLDSYLHQYHFECKGQNETDIGLIGIWIVSPFLVVCIRKQIRTLQHGLGLGWGTTGLGWVCHFFRFIFGGTKEYRI